MAAATPAIGIAHVTVVPTNLAPPEDERQPTEEERDRRAMPS